MTNPYFNHDTPLTRHTLGRAEQVNAIFQAVEAGFDKLPNPDVIAEGRVTYVVDEGTANAYAVTLAHNLEDYVEGMSFVMKAGNANTGPATVDVNELGVKQILRFNGAPLMPGDIAAGMLVELGYDGEDFRVLSVHGGEVALARAWATSTTPVPGGGGLKGARGYAQDAAASASAASGSAGNAASSALAAAGSAQDALNHYNAFRGIFYGAAAADPAVDPNGNPPTVGDWYFNSTTNSTRIFNGSTWDDVGAGTLDKFVYTAEGGETSLSGPDDNGRPLAYSVGRAIVKRNGADLIEGRDFTASTGTSIDDLEPLAAGEVVQIVVFSTVNIADIKASDIETADGASAQDAIAVSATPSDLLASTAQYTVGSTIRTANGFIYEVAPADASDAHVTTAGGVKLYVVIPEIGLDPRALGAPCDGEGDDAPFVERAWQITKHVNLASGVTYWFKSVIGIPDQTLYSPTSHKLTGWGATVVMDGASAGDDFLTSASAKLSPDSTSNLYTGKVDIIGITWNQVSPSIIINGDRVYNVNFAFNTCHAITSVARSYRAKGPETNGYIQSLYLSHNHFSNVAKIIDAKRGYNFRWDHNFAENCLGGIYIDGPDEAAVIGFSMTGGLFEGGGLAVKLGLSFGVTIKSVYFEANTIGDVVTEKCDILIGHPIRVRSSGVSIENCIFGVRPEQRDDPEYASIKEKFSSTNNRISPMEVRNCWTSGTRLWEAGRVLVQSGNAVSIGISDGHYNSAAPINPASARKTYWASRDVRTVAANNSAGVFSIAKIMTNRVMQFVDRQNGQRDASGTIYVRMAHMTSAGGVQMGAALAVIDFVAMSASAGIAPAQSPVDDVYMGFTLRSFVQIDAGQPMEGQFGSTTKTAFTSPTLSVTKEADGYVLKLSGYSVPSIPNWGAATVMVSNVTMDINAQNPLTLRSGSTSLIEAAGEININ